MGGPQGRTGWVQETSPLLEFDPRTTQPVASRVDCLYAPTTKVTAKDMPVALEVWKSKQQKRTDPGGGIAFVRDPRFVAALDQTVYKIHPKINSVIALECVFALPVIINLQPGWEKSCSVAPGHESCDLAKH